MRNSYSKRQYHQVQRHKNVVYVLEQCDALAIILIKVLHGTGYQYSARLHAEILTLHIMFIIRMVYVRRTPHVPAMRPSDERLKLYVLYRLHV